MPEILERVMQADRYRLQSQWQRIAAHDPTDQESTAYRKWSQAAHQSAQQFAKRRQSVPPLQYDADLPISAYREQIVELLRTRTALVVCGETGSGKSTQLPKFCLEAGLGISGMIGHTQPRRLAARAVASRLAHELATQIGGLVGFKIRFADSTSGSTLVKLMTDGVLLAETQSDRYFDHYDALIIDEAHERSLNIDFLLGYLRRIQAKRPELRIILTSATIDPQRFANHFADEQGPAPIIEVSGRTYPVELRYQPLDDSNSPLDLDEQRTCQGIAVAADQLLRGSSGDILTFLPTERDIRLASKYLRGHFAAQGRGGIEILPLYARLSQAEQNRIFTAHPGRRIVLATNVAESSLTVPGIRFVIDTGLVRMSRYASRSKVQRLPIEPVSQASANQRSGRCGRLGPGICIRLYSETDFLSRPKFTTPEIRRSDLANVLLQSQLLKLGPLEEFPLLDTPSAEALRDAQRTLHELGATDARHRLTDVGQQLGRLPCDVRVARMLLEAHQRRCLAEVIIIAAGLEAPDVRQRPAGQRGQADAAHQRFRDPHSDFLSLIRLWDFYENLRNQLSRSRLRTALQQHFLSYHGFQEWSELIRQLKDLLAAAGLRPGPRQLQLEPLPEVPPTDAQPPSNRSRSGRRGASEPPEFARPEGYAAIHQSLLAGLLSGIAEKQAGREYRAAGGTTIQLWPGSGLYHRPPQWIMAAEVVETSQRFGRTLAELDVEWIEHAGRDLLKHSHSDPHWSEKHGAAMVYRKSTLYGLTLVAGRRLPLAPLDAATARQLLIEHGLVAGQWRCDLPFYRHNLDMLADMEELMRRTRSRRYIVDHYRLGQFYSERLPVEAVDLASLRGWVQQHQGSPVEQNLWLSPEDMLADHDPATDAMDVASAFPNLLRVGAAEFPLTYHFEPGHESDGVTITVPRLALPQLTQQALDWLVPGLLEAKILAVIRALPKSLRTHFVPAPAAAAQIARQLASRDQSVPLAAAVAERLTQWAGQTITAGQLALENLPDHLRFRIQVLDDDGELVAAGRNLAQLVAQYAPADQAASTQLAAVGSLLPDSSWQPGPLNSAEELDAMPRELTLQQGGVTIAAYPAVVDTGSAVETRLVATAAEAQRLSRSGLTRLFSLKNQRSLRTQVKHLPQWNQAAIYLSDLMATDQLQLALQELIARLAFSENQPLPCTAAEFNARQLRATAQISVAAQEVSPWLPKLATHYHQLRLGLQSAPASWQAVVTEIRQQLAGLLTPGFLSDTPWQWLSEYPRYLQAARMRLDKLVGDGFRKDRRLAAPLETAQAAYQQAARSPRSNEPDFAQRVDNLRWALEEWRVSLFAQQLGTRMTVSPKRIQEMLQSLR